jgi:hypothetical protein
MLLHSASQFVFSSCFQATAPSVFHTLYSSLQHTESSQFAICSWTHCLVAAFGKADSVCHFHAERLLPLPVGNSHGNSLKFLTLFTTATDSSYFTTGALPPISLSWWQASLWRLTTSNFIFQLNTCGYSPYVTSSLMRGWVCHLQLLLVYASAFILRSESHRTYDQLLLSQIQDSPNLEGLVPVFISPRNRVARLYPQTLDSLVVASCDSQGYSGGILPRLHTGAD